MTYYSYIITIRRFLCFFYKVLIKARNILIEFIHPHQRGLANRRTQKLGLAVEMRQAKAFKRYLIM